MGLSYSSLSSSSLYDWIPELPDFRDNVFKYAHLNNKLPDRVDLRNNFKKYYHNVGTNASTCIGFVLDSYNLYYKYDKIITGNDRTIRDAIKNFSIIGQNNEIDKIDTREGNTKLKYMKIHNYKNHLRQSIYDGVPIIFGFSVFESFKNITDDGFIPIPKNNEKIIGGICCVIVGYDNLNEFWMLKHPLGDDFGDNGYIYMPYDMLVKANNLTTDFWRITKK